VKLTEQAQKRILRIKIFICKKEVQETKYWLEIISESNPEEKDSLKHLWKEAHELTLIFNKISTSLREKSG